LSGRRRKIRCTFSDDNTDVCSECFARGSRCIDQEHANPDSIVDHRKNLRERVSRLEALVDTLLEDKSERGAIETLRALREPLPHTPLSSDAASSVPAADSQAPIMTLFNNDVINRAKDADTAPVEARAPESLGGDGYPLNQCGAGTTANGTQIEFHCTSTMSGMIDQTTKAQKEKHERTRNAILSTLPPADELMKTLNSNQEWWMTFRMKCP
jgi:hypothetical protein